MAISSPYRDGALVNPPPAAPGHAERRVAFVGLFIGAAFVLALLAAVVAQELSTLQRVDSAVAAIFVTLAAASCAPPAFALLRLDAQGTGSDARGRRTAALAALCTAALVLLPLPVTGLALRSAPFPSALLLLAVPSLVLGLPAFAFLRVWRHLRKGPLLDPNVERDALILAGLLQTATAFLLFIILFGGGGPD